MRRLNIEAASVEVRRSFHSSAKPPIPEKKKYPAPLTYRPRDEEERQKVLMAAKGMSVSEYIRRCIHGADAGSKKHKLRTPVRDEQSLARALALLGQSRIANNLNQIAKEAHRGTLLLDSDTLSDIEAAYAHVCSMREYLVDALGLREARKK